MTSIVPARIALRPLLAVGIVCWLGACGSGSGDSEDSADSGGSADSGLRFVRTAEVCGVATDCKAEPDGDCKDTKIVVRFDVPTCGSDQRCTWMSSSARCDYMCQDGYCVSARVE